MPTIVPYCGDLETSAAVAQVAASGRHVVAAWLETGAEEPLDSAIVARRARALGAQEAVSRDVRGKVYGGLLVRLIRASGPGAEVPIPWLAAEDTGRAEGLLELAKERKAGTVALVDGALAQALEVRAPAGVRIERLRIDDPEGFLVAQGLSDEVPPPNDEGDFRVHASLWGALIRGGELEGSWDEVPEDAYPTLAPPAEAADLPEEFELSFENGLPGGLAGAPPDGVNLFTQLNRIGRRHSIGRGVRIEPGGGRLAWEAPAAAILVAAHDALERMLMSPPRRELKLRLAATYRELFADGDLHLPLAQDLEAFLTSSQRGLTGTVRVQVYRGLVEIMGVQA
ncbi:MAG: hypothetical protein HN750_10300 [Gemmatimonadales bacterium]|nr:hypothetical protein [Gemmatimonadales bacterium]